MDAVHVHLMLNHLPVVGTLVAVLVLFAGLATGHDPTRRVGLGILVGSALTILPAYLSGEGAEEIVEEWQQISEDLIEAHEEAALPAAIVLGLVGGLAAAGLWRFRGSERLPSWLTTTCLIGALLATGLMARTANLGGRIRHPELRGEKMTVAQRGERAPWIPYWYRGRQ